MRDNSIVLQSRLNSSAGGSSSGSRSDGSSGGGSSGDSSAGGSSAGSRGAGKEGVTSIKALVNAISAREVRVSHRRQSAGSRPDRAY